jgi:hypothetical protein
MLKLRSKMFRRVILTAHTIRTDRYDFTKFLGDVNLKIIPHFIDYHNEKVTCALLNQDAEILDQNRTTSVKWNCNECLSGENKQLFVQNI